MGAVAEQFTLSDLVPFSSSGGDALYGQFPPKPSKIYLTHPAGVPVWVAYERLRAVDAALQEQLVLGAAGDLDSS